MLQLSPARASIGHMKYVQWLLSREVVSPSVLAQIDTSVVNQILCMIQSNVKNSVPGISMNPI